MNLINAISNLAESITKLSKDLEKLGICSHELKQLNYYYDDDWGHRGNIVWNEHLEEKELCYCKKCGQVFLRESAKKKQVIKR